MNNSAQKYSKLQWTEQEEGCLKELKQSKKLKSWKTIAEILNNKFSDKNRNGKQCRERYMNYVRFNQQKPKAIGWNYEDDLILFDNFFQFGAKWVLISERMPGRSENCLKNRFYGALRRMIRKINKVEKQKKLKYKKTIKYDSLIRILSYRNFSEDQSNLNIPSQKSNLAKNLRDELVKMTLNQPENISSDEIASLIVKIHSFNCIGRNSSSKKVSSQTFHTSILVSSPQLLLNILNTKQANQDLPFNVEQQNNCFKKQFQISSEDRDLSSIMSIVSQYNQNKASFINFEGNLFQALCENIAQENQFYY